MIKGKKLNLDQNNVITINKNVIIISEFVFNKTCKAWPEQYDVYKGSKQVAYIRLRMGNLTVRVPDVDGELAYHKNFGENSMKGHFDNNKERMKYLTKIAEILKEQNNEIL